MGESASVEVLSAEVRVLQVGDGQITLSMYRQLDEATFERFEPFGRVRDNERKPTRKGALQLVGRDTETGTLVRCNAYPPNWATREGPPEFAHLLTHTKQSEPGPYLVADGPDARRVVWTRKWDPWGSCPGPSGWHDGRPWP